MARAAVLGRLTWQPATVTAARAGTATARTLVLDVAGWTGHVSGQHLDVRLTARRRLQGVPQLFDLVGSGARPARGNRPGGDRR